MRFCVLYPRSSIFVIGGPTDKPHGAKGGIARIASPSIPHLTALNPNHFNPPTQNQSDRLQPLSPCAPSPVGRLDGTNGQTAQVM